MFVDDKIIMKENAVVINDKISSAVDTLLTSGIGGVLDTYTLNYSDINYLSTIALLLRHYNPDNDKFTLTVTYAIDACTEKLLRDPESSAYKIKYENIFNFTPTGLETTLVSMGYTNPLVFALWVIRENLNYKHLKLINAKKVTVNNDGKSGVGAAKGVKNQ